MNNAAEGERLEIAFNAAYMKEALEATDAGQVTLETTVASSPGVVRAVGDDGWTHVIMPMAITK